MGTYEQGYLDGQRSVRQATLATSDYVNGVLQEYERDPASSDFQRGYLAAFREISRVLQTIIALSECK